MPLKQLRSAAPLVAITLSLAACMSATPYQPYRPESIGGVHGGYSEQRLAPDRFRVRFHGNELTSRERVEGYLLYRAAELTVQNGFDWFTIADRETNHETQTVIRPDPLYQPWFGSDYGYWLPDWSYYRRGYGWHTWHSGQGDPFWADRLDVSTVESFEASAEIRTGRNPLPSGDQRTFSARKVLTDLGPTIQFPAHR